MTLTLSIIDDTYSANDAMGRKDLLFTGSFVNPYTAGGETCDFSSYFKRKFYGGGIRAVNASVTTALSGIVSSGTFRGDTNSVATTNLSTGGGNPVLQLWAIGLSGTANAGLRVDNTTANISASTVIISAIGI